MNDQQIYQELREIIYPVASGSDGEKIVWQIWKLFKPGISEPSGKPIEGKYL